MDILGTRDIGKASDTKLLEDFFLKYDLHRDYSTERGLRSIWQFAAFSPNTEVLEVAKRSELS